MSATRALPTGLSRLSRQTAKRILPALAVVAAAMAAACSGAPKSAPPAATTSAPPTATASAPAASATPAAVAQTKTATIAPHGLVLTTVDGLTLYIFTRDEPGSGKSTCTGTCATNWPPLAATAQSIAKPDGATGAFGVITRDDGSKQITYAGRPLYRFAGDQKPGEAKGQGLNGNTWLVASAAPGAAGSTPTAPAAAPAASSGGLSPAPAPAAPATSAPSAPAPSTPSTPAPPALASPSAPTPSAPSAPTPAAPSAPAATPTPTQAAGNGAADY